MADEQSDFEKIRGEVELMSRSPFRNLLADLLECAPDKDSLRAFAQKSPDRWAQAIAIAGRLAGYTEKTETDVSVEINIASIKAMSDSQLIAELAAAEARLKALDAAPNRKALKPGPKRKKAGGHE